MSPVRRAAACSAVLALFAACGGAPAPPDAATALEPAESRSGDVLVRATVVPTMRLDPAMARHHGVERDPGAVLLVVGMRRGDAARETSLAGRVEARASDLLGNRQAIALREVRDEGFIDYAGAVRVSPPDTLRFEILARPDGAPPVTLRFHRDFFPQDR